MQDILIHAPCLFLLIPYQNGSESLLPASANLYEIDFCQIHDDSVGDLLQQFPVHLCIDKLCRHPVLCGLPFTQVVDTE